MIRKKLFSVVGAFAVMVLLAGSSFAEVSANYGNTSYQYRYQDDGEHSLTEWREKEYNGSNTPHGYIYAYCSYGLDSSIAARKKNSGDSTGVKCTDYVTIPYYKHTNIRNNFNKSSYKYVRLWVRTNSSSTTASTYGVWSPDSSQQYSHIVG